MQCKYSNVHFSYVVTVETNEWPCYGSMAKRYTPAYVHTPSPFSFIPGDTESPMESTYRKREWEPLFSFSLFNGWFLFFPSTIPDRRESVCGEQSRRRDRRRPQCSGFWSVLKRRPLKNIRLCLEVRVLIWKYRWCRSTVEGQW